MNIISKLFRKKEDKRSQDKDIDVVYDIFDALGKNGHFDAMDSILREVFHFAEKVETDILLAYCAHGRAAVAHLPHKLPGYSQFARKCVEIFKSRNVDQRAYKELEKDLENNKI